MTTVINIRTLSRNQYGHYVIPPGHVYVGREMYRYGLKVSNYHNPFRLEMYPLDQCLARYEALHNSEPGFKELVQRELADKVLMCWCRPPEGFLRRYICHAQWLAAIANGCRPEEIA